MCGIAGIVGSRLDRDELEAALRRMRARLAHRGPDGEGLWISPDGSAGLAHTRLAIIDTSADATQPMEFDGRHLVFNGEIYNYRELGGASLERGGDTRALLRHLAVRGIDGLGALAGMFAFGLYSERSRRLLLARDPLGIKPLYYAETSSGFVFASEVRAVLASGLISARADARAAAAFFRMGSVPEPLTAIEGVSCLPAGRYLERDAGGAVRICAHGSEGEPGESLDAALAESCRRHLVSDVPVGVFLSGGVDSTAVAQVATMEGQVTEAFSLVFSEQVFSEEAAIRAAATAMGLELHLKTLGREEARALFPRFLRAQDQPGIDGFNTFCVAGFARQRGFRVALSGVGGDELFGGYPSFRSVPAWTAVGRLIPRGMGRPLGALLDGNARSGKVRRVGSWLMRPSRPSSAYELVRGIFSEREAGILLSHFGMREPEPAEVGCSCDELEDPRLVVACLESSLYLRNQLLRESDAMTMAHGLELRLPLVDARLWACVSRMPPDRRFLPGKQALREAARGLDGLVSAGPKRAFTLPLQQWMDGAWEGMENVESLPGRLDLGHWSRKMAVISFSSYLRQHGVSVGA